MKKVRVPVSILICLTVFSGAFLTSSVHSYLGRDPFSYPTDTPDFQAFTNAAAKKQAFFQYLLPLIRVVNNRVLEQRKQLQNIAHEASQDALSDKRLDLLNQLSEEYELDIESLSLEETLSELMIRIDGLPESLVVAHAAKESGWGTSLHARQGSNYFGLKCQSQECGTSPLRQQADKSDSEPAKSPELRIFKTTKESVQAYFKELNSQSAYEPLREMRANMRQKGSLKSLVLAEQLSNYSPQDSQYVRGIQSIMRFNGLDQTASQP